MRPPASPSDQVFDDKVRINGRGFAPSEYLRGHFLVDFLSAPRREATADAQGEAA